MSLRNSCIESRADRGYTSATVVFACLSIVLLLVMSCRKECVDLCSDYGLILNKESCSCNCLAGLTAFEFDGYTYCIEESELFDIYILDNYNPSAWILDDEIHTSIPEILLSFVPKGLDSLESFYAEWPVGVPVYIHFHYYIQPINFPWGDSPFNRFNDEYIEVKKVVDNGTPEIFSRGVHEIFENMNIAIESELFNYGWATVGIILFSEDMDRMNFHYLGYNHLYDALTAYHNSSNSEEVFDFPITPVDTTLPPYDPYHLKLTFSRLNFEQ